MALIQGHRGTEPSHAADDADDVTLYFPIEGGGKYRKRCQFITLKLFIFTLCISKLCEILFYIVLKVFRFYNLCAGRQESLK